MTYIKSFIKYSLHNREIKLLFLNLNLVHFYFILLLYNYFIVTFISKCNNVLNSLATFYYKFER